MWPLRERKLRALRRTLEEPNAADSFRTLIEQVIEDALTGGFGAIEMEPTGDPERPAMLWAVDGARSASTRAGTGRRSRRAMRRRCRGNWSRARWICATTS